MQRLLATVLLIRGDQEVACRRALRLESRYFFFLGARTMII